MVSVVNKIVADLSELIRNGDYPAESLLPRRDELAERFGCSPASMERVLTRLARDGLVRRIRRKGTIVNAMPACGQGNVCLLQSTDLHTNGLLTDAIFSELTGAGHHVDIIPNVGDLVPAMTVVERLSKRAGGLGSIVLLWEPVPWCKDELRQRYESLIGRFRDRILFSDCGERSSKITATRKVVGIDLLHQQRSVMEYLVGLGHRSIAIAAGLRPDEASKVSENFRVCEQLLKMVGGKAVPVYFGVEEYGKALPDLFRREGVTAYWAITDEQAFAAANLFLQQGYAIPSDISILGRNDTPWCSQASPPLTSVSLNPKGVAAAVRQALESPSPDGVLRVQSQVIARESTGPVPARALENTRIGTSDLDG